MEHTSLGIDISSKRLDCYWLHSNKHQVFENSLSGIAQLVAKVKKEIPQWVIFEPTGGYEIDLCIQFAQAGIAFSMVQPYRLRSFARSCGKLAKTDKLDAKLMAIYGSTMKPKATIVGTKAQQELSGFVARRRQLVDLLSMERQRLDQWRDSLIRKDVEDHCNYLKQHILALEQQIQACINQEDTLQQVSKALQNVPGVGPTSAAVLLADLPELGHIGSKEIASLVGVAPFNVESGNSIRKGRIRGGRLSVRCMLYMVTLVAIRHNAIIRDFYQRLRAQQKPAKVAIVACMRKILIILNAIARDHFKKELLHA
jgi:transposase